MHNKLGQSNCLLSSTIAFYSTPSRGISQVSTCIKKTPDPVHLTQPSRYNLSFQSSPHSISSSRVTLQLGNNIFPTLVITFSIPYWKISHIFSSCWSARLSWFLVVLDALIIYRHYPYIYIFPFILQLNTAFISPTIRGTPTDAKRLQSVPFEVCQIHSTPTTNAPVDRELSDLFVTLIHRNSSCLPLLFILFDSR